MTKHAWKPLESAKDSKFLRLVLAGILGTLAFNFAMYADISITGVPLDIANMLGQLTVGESELAPIVGHAIHLGNGIGLALLFGYVALPISKRSNTKHNFAIGHEPFFFPRLIISFIP